MNEKKSVKFLTVVWGQEYIKRFCALSLPSFLAPGNIPALAEAIDLEVVIMTKQGDIEFFKRDQAFERLKKICAVRFVPIDDLVTKGYYGITLTLAYARPIIALGEDMLNHHFLFMNADFILADKSLKSLLKHIFDDRSILLAPSYRAITEELEPKLVKLVDPACSTLSVQPRAMVKMAMKHPHRTTIAKTFRQNIISSTNPNQFFWQVDNNTLLGRYFLSFMLCIKPERTIKTVNCFCDYSLIPELAPSGDEVMMGDSDDFFMLELQSRGQETEMLRPGRLRTREIALSLTEWTTPEHRRASAYDVVFHSEDIPDNIKQAKAEANNTISNIHKQLGDPQSHQNHYYWASGLIYWRKELINNGISTLPKELATPPFNLRAEYFHFIHRMATTLRWYRARTRQYFTVKYWSNKLSSLFHTAEDGTGFLLKAKHLQAIRSMATTLKWYVARARRYFLAKHWSNKLLSQLQTAADGKELLIIGDGKQARNLIDITSPAKICSIREYIYYSRYASRHNRRFDMIVYSATSIDKQVVIELQEMLGFLEKDGELHLICDSFGGPVISNQEMADAFSLIVEVFGDHLYDYKLELLDSRSLYYNARVRNRIKRIILLPLFYAISVVENYFSDLDDPTASGRYPVAFHLSIKPPKA
ncbi:MAG: hypothetical protein OEZ28_00235 [Nitrospinota bacterium]|nr:hypothetical protein [Nitrospinota bacterium]